MILKGAEIARYLARPDPSRPALLIHGQDAMRVAMKRAEAVKSYDARAATAGVAQPSHVLIAMGADPDSARGSLRLSLGHTSTDADVDAALDVLPAAVERARQAALAASGVVD